ncbi:hypothetical protein [Pseudoxanthomonas winnipegensis]|uniref:Uncharacterized protein n=1 Tax=Pseudoxanthomonas winnipegensis TaxID=2480810 RepID=A0A4V6MKV4_9GAMM|nr:hypothetical protein [Pseudoxanthomonas winnipegensis]RZZ84781.1 hypothetical protein EA663_13395 [Pseudoxanthomonas winnipegensis]TAA33722.1 hypothetical protein EA656_14890 [Pseudoxanthomonas winnipegensis]
MRANNRRRLAALENRPLPARLSAENVAFQAYLVAFYDAHAGTVDQAIVEALNDEANHTTPARAAGVWLDFIEAVGRIDKAAADQLYADWGMAEAAA